MEKKPDMKADAKLKMLQELKKMASDMLGGDLKSKMDGMKKVTVASTDKEGLAKGLDKAKKMVAGQDPATEEAEEMLHKDIDGDNEEGESPEHKMKVLGMEPEEGSEEEESEESPEEEASEDDEMSPEAIKAKIAELQSKLSKSK